MHLSQSFSVHLQMVIYEIFKFNKNLSTSQVVETEEIGLITALETSIFSRLDEKPFFDN